MLSIDTKLAESHVLHASHSCPLVRMKTPDMQTLLQSVKEEVPYLICTLYPESVSYAWLRVVINIFVPTVGFIVT